METPDPRASFDRIVTSAKRAGLLKALFETEGVAIIEIPLATVPPEITPPAQPKV